MAHSTKHRQTANPNRAYKEFYQTKKPKKQYIFNGWNLTGDYLQTKQGVVILNGYRLNRPLIKRTIHAAVFKRTHITRGIIPIMPTLTPHRTTPETEINNLRYSLQTPSLPSDYVQQDHSQKLSDNIKR